jgi:hypothetical protein
MLKITFPLIIVFLTGSGHEGREQIADAEPNRKGTRLGESISTNP